jgi:hypothetical protein
MKYDSGKTNDLLDQAQLITDTGNRRALCARIWAREAQDLSSIGHWFNHASVGLPAKGDGFVPVAVAMARLQEMKLLP